MSVKQDRQGARTLADLERKYNFGRSFAEVIGIATDARNATAELDKKLAKEIADVRKEITQTDSGLIAKVEAEYTKKTTFAEFANIVSAQLEMKIGEDDSGKLISMINASADIINLNSNRLVIDSDYFKLSYNGVASINSAQIDYARMVGARIGSAYFSDNGDFVTPQINFLEKGIYLSQKLNPADNRDCFVWESDGATDIFRMYGDSNGLHIEGLDHDDGSLDLVVFGISLRDLYNKVNGTSGGDTGGGDSGGDIIPDCAHSNTSDGGNIIDACHSEMWTECLDCGTMVNLWTEEHHDVNDSGYCKNCGLYVG